MSWQVHPLTTQMSLRSLCGHLEGLPYIVFRFHHWLFILASSTNFAATTTTTTKQTNKWIQAPNTLENSIFRCIGSHEVCPGLSFAEKPRLQPAWLKGQTVFNRVSLAGKGDISTSNSQRLGSIDPLWRTNRLQLKSEKFIAASPFPGHAPLVA